MGCALFVLRVLDSFVMLMISSLLFKDSGEFGIEEVVKRMGSFVCGGFFFCINYLLSIIKGGGGPD